MHAVSFVAIFRMPQGRKHQDLSKIQRSKFIDKIIGRWRTNL